MNYLLQDSDGDTLIKSNESISTIQRWALYWDKNHNLWVYSSDIGSFIWQRDPNNPKKYGKIYVSDSQELRTVMPKELLQ